MIRSQSPLTAVSSVVPRYGGGRWPDSHPPRRRQRPISVSESGRDQEAFVHFPCPSVDRPVARRLSKGKASPNRPCERSVFVCFPSWGSWAPARRRRISATGGPPPTPRLRLSHLAHAVRDDLVRSRAPQARALERIGVCARGDEFSPLRIGRPELRLGDGRYSDPPFCLLARSAHDESLGEHGRIGLARGGEIQTARIAGSPDSAPRSSRI